MNGLPTGGMLWETCPWPPPRGRPASARAARAAGDACHLHGDEPAERRRGDGRHGRGHRSRHERGDLGGIFLGSGTSGTVIGGEDPFQANRVLFNGGTGITIVSSTRNRILGNEIRANVGYGLYASGSCRRTRVIENLFAGNTLGSVNIASATGITYVP